MMPAFDRASGFEIDAERCAEHLQLDIVHGERVARRAAR